jgi:hypothetical protein
MNRYTLLLDIRRPGGAPCLLDEYGDGLREAPQRVRYRDPLTDETREDDLTTAAVAGIVRLYAYAPQLAAMLLGWLLRR